MLFDYIALSWFEQKWMKKFFLFLVCWNTPKKLCICFCVLVFTEDTGSTSTAVTMISSLWNRSLCQPLSTKKTPQCQFSVSGKILVFLCKTACFKAIWLKSAGHQSKNILNNAHRGPISRMIYMYMSLVKDPCIQEKNLLPLWLCVLCCVPTTRI